MSLISLLLSFTFSCEYPLSYFQRMRGSSSRYTNSDDGDSFGGVNRHQIRRFRRTRKHHSSSNSNNNNKKQLLESKLLAALDKLLKQNSWQLSCVWYKTVPVVIFSTKLFNVVLCQREITVYSQCVFFCMWSME